MKISISSIVLVFFSCSIFAQEIIPYERNFEAYQKYHSEKSGVIFKIPEKFKDMNKYFVAFKIREDTAKYIGNRYGPLLISKDKQCIVMYPAMVAIQKDYTTEKLFSYRMAQIFAEIETALGFHYGPGNPNNRTGGFNSKNHITTIIGERILDMYNADASYIYDIPGADSTFFLMDKQLEIMRKKKYPNCTGLLIHKEGIRGGIYLMFLFTEKGKKNKEKYINMLSKKIWYDENFVEQLMISEL